MSKPTSTTLVFLALVAALAGGFVALCLWPYLISHLILLVAGVTVAAYILIRVGIELWMIARYLTRD